MTKENKIGQAFENVSQRVVYNFMCQVPAFRPVVSELANESSQKQFYEFMCDFYDKIYHSPQLIKMECSPDECEDKPHNGKSYLETRKTMRADAAKLTKVFELLIRIVLEGEINKNKLTINKKAFKINQLLSDLLTAVGFQSVTIGDALTLWSDAYPDMLPGFKLLSTISAAQEKEKLDHSSPSPTAVKYFYHLCFDPDYKFMFECYSELVKDKTALHKIMEYAGSHDFILQTTCNEEMKINYKKEYKVTINNKAESASVSVDAYYDGRYYNQLLFTFISDKNIYKYFLPRFSGLDKDIQQLFFDNTKQCDSCGFCHQRNRTLPLAFIPCEYKGETINFCYYFQYIRFRELNMETVDKVIRLFDYIDSVLARA